VDILFDNIDSLDSLLEIGSIIFAIFFGATLVWRVGYRGLKHSLLPLSLPAGNRYLMLSKTGRIIAAIGNIIGGAGMVIGFGLVLYDRETFGDVGGITALISIGLILLTDVIGYLTTGFRPRIATEKQLEQWVKDVEASLEQ
jgi:membrane-bound metal-dependent hydrolase YbcI (DUF457 family)